MNIKVRYIMSIPLKSPTLRPRRERWKQVMLANRALVKLHRPIPRAVDVTDYRILSCYKDRRVSSSGFVY